MKITAELASLAQDAANDVTSGDEYHCTMSMAQAALEAVLPLIEKEIRAEAARDLAALFGRSLPSKSEDKAR